MRIKNIILGLITALLIVGDLEVIDAEHLLFVSIIKHAIQRTLRDICSDNDIFHTFVRFLLTVWLPI